MWMKSIQLKWGTTALACLVGASMLAACSSNSASSGSATQTADKDKGQTAAPAKPPEPVTLKFMVSTTEENFNRLFRDNPAIKEKLPHLTLQYMNINDWTNSITAGVIPDLINVTGEALYRTVIDSKLEYDHTEIMTKTKFDMNRFGKEYLDMLRLMGDGKKLIALPDKVDYPYESAALLYNKSIFDKFAVPYPKDNMTWDDVLELAKKFNRLEGGVQYRGLVNIGLPNVLRSQFGLQYTDRNDTVDLSAPQWAQMVKYVKDLAVAQDNLDLVVNANVNPFLKEQTAAMLAGVVTTAFSNIEESEGKVDWNMVTLPRIWGSQDVTLPGSSGFYAITSTSKNKEAAAQLLQAIYDSNTAKANIERPVLAKRNLAAIKDKKRAIPVAGRYDGALTTILNNKLLEMIKQNKDVNTVIREMTEEMQKRVDQDKPKK
jgi:multiple sugar transport system substrate-binding protein